MPATAHRHSSFGTQLPELCSPSAAAVASQTWPARAGCTGPSASTRPSPLPPSKPSSGEAAAASTRSRTATPAMPAAPPPTQTTPTPSSPEGRPGSVSRCKPLSTYGTLLKEVRVHVRPCESNGPHCPCPGCVLHVLSCRPLGPVGHWMLLVCGGQGDKLSSS